MKTSRPHLALSAATLLVASVSAGLAQDAGRSWVDPPSSAAPADETVTYPEAPPSPAKRAAPETNVPETDAEAPPVRANRPEPASVASAKGTPSPAIVSRRAGRQKVQGVDTGQRKSSTKTVVATKAPRAKSRDERRDVVATGALPRASRTERRLS